MKLYQKYTEIVRRLGRIETAWYTTFNVDPELAERFLFAPLVGRRPADMRTAEDFEALNTELAGIDLAVWYDYRAMNMKTEKFTCVDFIPVDPAGSFPRRSKETVFHPKVIFLKGEQGAYLFTGSANLSIAAWSTNFESVLIKKIEMYENAREVLDFFGNLRNINKKLNEWAASLPHGKSDWHFISSFSKGFRLTDHLAKEDLTVWSPYYSVKTFDFVKDLLEEGYKKIALVPHIDDNGRIGIPPEEIPRLSSMRVQILRNLNRDERQGLHHAKVWLTPGKIAVGSWNCSRRATGTGIPDKEKNIEAGIVAEILPGTEKKLLEKVEPFSHPEDLLGQTREELDQEWEQMLNKFSMTVLIAADWDKFEYKLLMDVREKEKYYVSLPHAPATKTPLRQVTGTSFRNNFTKVLKNKLYIVTDTTGKILFQGYLQEQKTEKRPAYGYASLPDLLESLLEDPSGSTIKKRCQYQLEEEEGISDTADRGSIGYRGAESYYIMFVSFQNLYERIQEMEARQDKLDELGFRLPGSLINIRHLVEDSLHKLEEKEKPEKNHLLFHYFLISETNRCIDTFNHLCRHKIPLLEQTYLIRLKDMLGFTKKEERFLKRLQKDFGYGVV